MCKQDTSDHTTGWAKKAGPQTHDRNSVKPEPILIEFTGKLINKFVDKWIIKLPPHVAYVATLPCETFMSAKQAINHKILGMSN